jgi:hypothetical protein
VVDFFLCLFFIRSPIFKKKKLKISIHTHTHNSNENAADKGGGGDEDASSQRGGKRKRGEAAASSSSAANSSDDSDVTMYTVCAIGSLDCNLSIWVTGRPRALTVLNGFFTEAVSDISFAGACLKIFVFFFEVFCLFLFFFSLGSP